LERNAVDGPLVSDRINHKQRCNERER
jgi:hypothetical protein